MTRPATCSAGRHYFRRVAARWVCVLCPAVRSKAGEVLS